MIVYKATNLINGKVYIGQTIKKLSYRKSQHKRDAYSAKRRKTIPFHNAIYKYGIENFEFKIIDYAHTQEELDELERFWIIYYKSNDRNIGYNRDSGGRSGGIKSEETKKLIGETTRIKWEDPQTAKKMMDGLRKGTQTWKKQCASKRIPFTCPICGKQIMITYSESQHRKSCSKECSRRLEHPPQSPEKIAKMRETHRKNHLAMRQPAKEFIIKWCIDHKDIINHIPLNRITPTLQPMMTILDREFDIHDMRSLFVIFDVKNRKELVRALQKIIE